MGHADRARRVARPRAATALGDLIRDALRRSPLANQKELATEAQVSDSVVSALITAERQVPRKTVLAIARAINPDQNWLSIVEKSWQTAKAAWASESAAPLASEPDQPPAPTPLVRELLLAQRRAAHHLPYRLLIDRTPPLSALYVEQHSLEDQLRALHDDGGPPGFSSSPGPQLVVNVLHGHRNILLTADAGGGKSTLLYRLAAESAAWWLADPADRAPQPPCGWVVPIRVRAATIASLLLADAIAATTRNELCEYLDSPVDAELFRSSPGLNLHWLLLVDGVDEIIDAVQRERVISALARRIEEVHQIYRFLVASRPLSNRELVPLRDAGAAHYRLKPFSPAQLDEFAGNWFRARGSAAPSTKAAAFIRAISGANLESVVALPLLTTIAAIVFEHSNDGQLSASRTGLYTQFFHYLLDVRQQYFRARTKLIETLNPYPHGSELAVWLFENVVILLEEIARDHIEGRARELRYDSHVLVIDSHIMTAVKWTKEQSPHPITAIPDWAGCVRSLLIGTGILRAAGQDLEFTHQSFAEFLTGGWMARVQLADGFTPAACTTFTRLLVDDATRNSAMFALGRWVAQEPVCNNTLPLLERLLAGPARHVLLAAGLVAESICDSNEVKRRVRDRLSTLALNKQYGIAAINALGTFDKAGAIRITRKLIDSADPSIRSIEIVRRFDEMGFHDDAVAALMALDAVSTTASQRIAVAIGLAEIHERGRATELLLQLAREELNVSNVVDLVRALTRLNQTDVAMQCALAVYVDDFSRWDDDMRSLGVLLAHLGHKPAARQCVMDLSGTWAERQQFLRLADFELITFGWERICGCWDEPPPASLWYSVNAAGRSVEVIRQLQLLAQNLHFEGSDSLFRLKLYNLTVAIDILGAPELAGTYAAELACSEQDDWLEVRNDAASLLFEIVGEYECVRILSAAVRDRRKTHEDRVAATKSLIQLSKVNIAQEQLLNAVGSANTDLVEWFVQAQVEEPDDGVALDASAQLIRARWPGDEQ